MTVHRITVRGAHQSPTPSASSHSGGGPPQSARRFAASRTFMARLARPVLPGLPASCDAAGNGRAPTFFCDADYALYRGPAGASCRAAEVEIWAWCLMPNHVHLILVPADEDGLRGALAPVHRRYSGHHSCALQADRPLLAGPLRLRRDGRGASCRGAPLRRLTRCGRGWSARPQTGAGPACGPTSAAGADRLTDIAPVHERLPRFREFPVRGRPMPRMKSSGCAAPKPSAGRSAIAKIP